MDRMIHGRRRLPAHVGGGWVQARATRWEEPMVLLDGDRRGGVVPCYSRRLLSIQAFFSCT
jgi:hypothetical protein